MRPRFAVRSFSLFNRILRSARRFPHPTIYPCRKQISTEFRHFFGHAATAGTGVAWRWRRRAIVQLAGHGDDGERDDRRPSRGQAVAVELAAELGRRSITASCPRRRTGQRGSGDRRAVLRGAPTAGTKCVLKRVVRHSFQSRNSFQNPLGKKVVNDPAYTPHLSSFSCESVAKIAHRFFGILRGAQKKARGAAAEKIQTAVVEEPPQLFVLQNKHLRDSSHLALG